VRIVSLLPSATEIICRLGLGDQLVGVTHECDEPPWVRHLPRVTRSLIPADTSSRQIDEMVREKLRTQRALYTLDWPVLESLRPELLVTQALCDVCAVAEAEVRAAACSLPGQPQVVNLEPQSLEDVFATFHQVAAAAQVPERAAVVVGELRQRVQTVARRSAQLTYRPRVVLLEWIDPPFCCGHWTPELIRLAGGREMIGREGHPSRTLRWEEVVAAEPEVLVIACCGFDIARAQKDLPILQAYPGYEQLPAVRNNRVYWIDGNAYFSRPGPRLVDSLEWLAHLLHPDIHPAPLLAANRTLTVGAQHDSTKN
jgi:iron complex transport system substrate-binding protein